MSHEKRINKEGNISDKTHDTSFLSYLCIVTFGIFIFFLYILLIVNEPKPVIWPVNLFFAASDRYMDFFNCIIATQKLDVYTHYHSASSPFFFIICFLINKIVPAISADQYGVRYLLLGKTVYGIYIFISLSFFIAAFNKLFNKFKVLTKERIWFYLIFLFSYPVLFSIDRGNYALMTGGLIALFLILFASGKNIAAAVILGIAISLKYYYAPFAILFLIDRKLIAFVVSTATAGLILCCSLASFEGGLTVNANSLYNNLLHYNSAGLNNVAEALGYNTSIYMLFDIPYAIKNNLFNKGTETLVSYHCKIAMLANILLFLILMLSVCIKKLHDRMLLVTIGILLFPFLSIEYIIPVIFMPAAYWLLNEPKDRIMPWLLGLYVICKKYYSFYDQGDLISVTIQSILNPLLLLMIITYIICLRRVELNEFFKMLPRQTFKLIKCRCNENQNAV